MTRLLTAAALFASTTGCIYYENNGEGWDDDDCTDCEWWNDGDDSDGEIPDGDTGDTEEPEPTFELDLDPGQIAQGDADVAMLSVAAGQFDMGAVIGVSVLGPVDVTEALPRDGGYLLVLEADADAPLGTYHLLLDLQDGTAVLFEDSLEVVAPASSGDTGEGCP